MRIGSAVGEAAVIGYELLCRARDKGFSVLISGGFAAFGRKSIIQLPVRIKRSRRISIGDNVFVGAGTWLHAEPGTGVALVIGDGVEIAGLCAITAVSSVTLERGVALARNVFISDHSHEYDDPTRAVVEQGITQPQPVVIGAGAWLGQNVVVMPGVRIGRGAVVSAGSVVSRDIPDHSLAMGTPARVIRRFGPQNRNAPE